MTTCDHGFRWGSHLARCDQPKGHLANEHSGRLETGSVLTWQDGDRRDFRGDDPGQCDAEAPAERNDEHWSDVDAGPGSRCILPRRHWGRHAS